MDILTYLAQELPKKKAQSVAKQLEYLGLEPGHNVKESKKKIVQFYLDNHLSKVLLYYQMGSEVVNPKNKQGLTTQVNKLFGVWDLRDIDDVKIPATVTKPFNELIKKYHKVIVK